MSVHVPLARAWTTAGRKCSMYSSSILPRLYCNIKMGGEKMIEVPNVDIEDKGTFKYVLIKLYAKENADGKEPSKIIVRGGQKYGPYHSDIYDATMAIVQKLDLDSECLGGGRICHDPENKKLNVYGYSQGFGKADHQITAELLKRKYCDYTITWSDEGY